MSSQESKKSAAKFGKFASKKSSAKFTVPKLTKPKEEAPSVSVDAKPQPKKAEEKSKADEPEQTTEELPEDELLDEDDLEEIDDNDLLGDGELDGDPVITGVASGSIDTPANETIKMPAEQRPVDPYGATQTIGADEIAALKAHRAAAAAAASTDGVVGGVLGGELPGISADPLAAPLAPRPVTNEEAEAQAAVAALDGLDDGHAVERSMNAVAPIAAMPAPPPQAPMPMGPGSTGPFQAAPPGPSSSGPFPAVQTPPPGYVLTPAPQQRPQMYAPTPLPQQAPQLYTPTPLPQQAPPPDPMAIPTPAPGTMEAARQASWKQAHPSARRWAKRRDAHSGTAGRRTPQPLRIGAGLLLIGVGIYLLAIFIPAHSPNGPRESERTEAGKVWRFSETQHGAASGLAFGLVGLGLFGMLSGAFYRREITAHCRSCKMAVEVTREGLSLRCHNGGHKAGLDKSTVGMLAVFVIVGSGTLVLLLTASLG